MRVKLTTRIGSAKLDLQIDIGFGDVVTPPASVITFPTLLDAAPVRLRAYSRESVVAEKVEAMVHLGIANSRMKDFYDVWIISRRFGFDGPPLCEALRATFKRRETTLPDKPPAALTEGFSSDQNKLRQWQAFLKKSKAEAQDLGQVVEALRLFLMPPAQAAAQGETFEQSWLAGGPWIPSPRTKVEGSQ